MATRRSRLSVKPNLGLKIGAAKAGSTKPKPGADKKGVPKKETLDRLRKKVSEDDIEKDPEKDLPVAQEDTEGLNQPTSDKVGNVDPDDKTEVQKSEIMSPVKKDQSLNYDDGKDIHEEVITGSQSLDKAGANEKDSGNSVPVMTKLPVSPKNKVQMITRNRLPKARPNLADAGRPRKAPEQTSKAGINQSGPLSPIKMPRPIISQSPDKALSSPEKSVVVARELKVHYQATNTTDNSDQASSSDTKTSGETTVTERRHRNLSGIDVPPIIERRQRQMSTSETALGEKRHRHTSVAETPTPKRKKHAKIDAPTDVPVDRTKIKMGDLIYWNPTSNPMKKKAGQDKKKKKSVSPSDDEEEEEEAVVSLTAPTPEEEKLDDPEPMEDEAMPVPQVKIGPDGNIIINEESLVIKNNDNIIEEDGDVIDETDSTVTYTSFRKQRTKLSWSEKETQRFYKALSYIGTDFSLMLSVFPKRTRNDIKKKFAIEDKRNRDKVEAALRNKKPFTMAVFEEEEEETEVEKKKPAKSRKRSKKENKTVDKSTRKCRDDWKYYYKGKEESEEVEAKKAAQKRQQVEEARRRLLATRNSSQKVPRGPEESNEIVEILMNMSKGSNPVPPVPDAPHVENVMVMQSGMPVVDIGTDTEQLVQLLQTSGQAALIGDNVNEPLILVYNRPTVPGGETVIHVYKIQPDSSNPLNITTAHQQPNCNSLLNVTTTHQQPDINGSLNVTTTHQQPDINGSLNVTTTHQQPNINGSLNVTTTHQQPNINGSLNVTTTHQQPDINGSLNVTIAHQQEEVQPGNVYDTQASDNSPACIDVNLSRTSDSRTFINVSNSDSSTHTPIHSQADFSLTSSTGMQNNLELQTTSQNIPNRTEEVSDCVPSGHFYHNLHNYSENVSLTHSSTVQSPEQLVTDVGVPETCCIQDGIELEQSQDGVDSVSHRAQGKAVVVKNEQQQNTSGVEPFTELGEQYIDDMTSVVPGPLQYTCNS